MHKSLLVIDLHCDALLWDRDLLDRSDYGHVDLPRMREGGIGLQAFTAVTSMPTFANIDKTEARLDIITALVILQRWPPRTWGSLKERALYQAKKLHDVQSRSKGSFRVIKSGTELERYLKTRESNPGLTAGFLGIEGMHALENNLDNIDALYAAGFRMMAPTHFFDNEMGGSAHGVSNGGLTDFGRKAIARMQKLHILLDLAHASPRLFSDAMAIANGPVMVSHTGVKGACDNNRTMSDGQLRAIATTGGVVGIGFWKTAVCGESPAAIARAMRYTANLIGAEHVALGSDFDGAVAAPFDAAGLAQLTQALLDEGFAESEIRKIMGLNAARVLQQVLE